MSAKAWDAWREVGIVAGVSGDTASECLRLIADRLEQHPSVVIHAVTFDVEEDGITATVIATDLPDVVP